MKLSLVVAVLMDVESCLLDEPTTKSPRRLHRSVTHLLFDVGSRLLHDRDVPCPEVGDVPDVQHP